MWHAALEEASRLYFSQNDVQGMLDALMPLHVELERGPQTTSEASFQQAFGGELHEAHERCQRFVATGQRAELSGAWDIYYHVFRRISKQIAKLAVRFTPPRRPPLTSPPPPPPPPAPPASLDLP